MKKDSTMTVGMDVGDRNSQVCILGEDGEILEESRVPTSRAGITRKFKAMAPCRIAIETGAHSRWIHQLLTGLGHEVIVANPRKLRMIYMSDSKSDHMDALMLAKLARVDPSLLYAVTPRSQESQNKLAIIHARATLVEVRTKLVNHVRGVCKASGERLKGCSARAFHTQVPGQIPEPLRPALDPLVTCISSLSEQIKSYDQVICRMVKDDFPQAKNLAEIPGVGPLTALTFVLTLDNPRRFQKSRSVGAFLGIRPRRDQSGEADKQLRITKAGDCYLRALLVQCAHHILGPHGRDSSLRRWGLALAERGGKRAKRKAAVALARKLAVVMHRLWVTGSKFEPFYNHTPSRTLRAAS